MTIPTPSPISDFFKPIVAYVDAQTTLTLDTDLFPGDRPLDAPDACVGLYERGGATSYESLGMLSIRIQVLARGKTYFEARDLAFLVYNVLHGMAGVDLPVLTSGESWTINTCRAPTLPQLLGRDETGRTEFTANYIFEAEEL